MPLIYETHAEMAEDGHLLLEMNELPFKKGTRFTVKLVPEQELSAEELYRYLLQELQRSFRQHDPFAGLTDDEITAELRRQREAMYAD